LRRPDDPAAALCPSLDLAFFPTGIATRLLRLVRMHLHLLKGVVLAVLVYRRADQSGRARILARWSRELLDILNVRVVVRGRPPAVPGGLAMVVGNHISWMDIFVVDACAPSRFVAKSEVRGWPVIGWLSACAGTLFVDRGRRHDTVRTNRAIGDAIRAGDCVAIYPEGTTTDGSVVRPFHGSLLQPAVEAGATLYPAALRYLDADGELAAAPVWVGDTTFAQSVFRIIRAPELVAEVNFLEPIPSAGRDRRELAHAAEAATAAALGLPPPRRQPGRRADLRA
jgi:1-acyl-sn-glycerol-3-phosphate acyltransferase